MYPYQEVISHLASFPLRRVKERHAEPLSILGAVSLLAECEQGHTLEAESQ